ncbi:hypothetical protein CBM2588_A210028 [Cupriavidus taiwanensis]|nr:hypothetical protein CBM2588_A210028 [Cupriavidus taiwanensis]
MFKHCSTSLQVVSTPARNISFQYRPGRVRQRKRQPYCFVLRLMTCSYKGQPINCAGAAAAR